MAEAIDFVWLGERLKQERKSRDMTLEEVSAETKISVPTLSRVERGDANGLQSGTLIALSEWVGTSTKLWKRAKQVDNMPDFVELHLRADKNLDRKTALALAQLFRSTYDQVKRKQKE